MITFLLKIIPEDCSFCGGILHMFESHFACGLYEEKFSPGDDFNEKYRWFK